MEPMRPDDDELRAEQPVGAPDQKKQTSSAKGNNGKSGPPKSAKKNARGGRGGSGPGLAVLWLLVIAVALAAGAGWYYQSQRLQMLEGQLEEADYWARQSKLALARFEGDLSETGERGASLTDQIASQKQQLDEADSEIRKLWAVANERNKERLNDHQDRIAAAESESSENRKALADVDSTIEEIQASLEDDIAAITEQTEASVADLQDADQQMADELASLSKQVASVDDVVDRRVQRFEQEQKLGISDIEGRLSVLEKKLDKLSGNQGGQELKGELAALKKNVQAIDSSRAQLTSRLVRLSEEVNQLRSRISN